MRSVYSPSLFANEYVQKILTTNFPALEIFVFEVWRFVIFRLLIVWYYNFYLQIFNVTIIAYWVIVFYILT